MLTSELTICVKLINLLNQAMKRQSLYVKLSFTTFQRTSVQWQPFFAGKVDQIIVTGGIAYNEWVINELKKYCGWVADFTVYPGEDELLALAQGGLKVYNGEETAKIY